MLIVIGKIEDDSGKLEACRVIDSNTKEVQDVYIKKIEKALKEKHIKLKGFRLVEVNDYPKETIKESLRKEKTARFKYSKIPSLNGAGNPRRPEDEQMLTLFGWKGFAEMKEYHLFNYKGEETVLNATEFKDKVASGLINGAALHPRTGKPVLSQDLNIELN